MIFLKENGKLEEFVEAKMLGKEPVAKWLLLESNKREIEIIQEKQRKKEEERLEQEARNMIVPDKPTYNGPANEKKFIMTSSINPNEPMKDSDKVFNLNF
jgi:hypothetical protein